MTEFLLQYVLAGTCRSGRTERVSFAEREQDGSKRKFLQKVQQHIRGGLHSTHALIS
jgi:hypothetical protein